MGQSKLRRDEIVRLKQNSPAEAARWRQLQNDGRTISVGINPESHDIEIPAATTRTLSALFTEAKQTGNVDPPVTLLYSTINATVRGLSDIPIACRKGCAHCCYIWVTVSAPEALFIAKIVKQRGEAAIAKVRLAHENTNYDFENRNVAYPCPLLDGDTCSIYDHRPKACRLASSADAEICARSYRNITTEDIPTPEMFMTARGMYSTVMAVSLKHANLPHYGYEFNAALIRALDTDQAEKRWLAGEDIFADIHRDPGNALGNPQADLLYENAFGAK